MCSKTFSKSISSWFYCFIFLNDYPPQEKKLLNKRIFPREPGCKKKYCSAKPLISINHFHLLFQIYQYMPLVNKEKPLIKIIRHTYTRLFFMCLKRKYSDNKICLFFYEYFFFQNKYFLLWGSEYNYQFSWKKKNMYTFFSLIVNVVFKMRHRDKFWNMFPLFEIFFLKTHNMKN